MSGHSKWSKVKHQKATTDVVKAAAFTHASRAVTVAVIEGGGIGDPEKNFKLRLAVAQARAVNMPKENIARAIEKGMGSGQGSLEYIAYEAYGPGGVALVIEAATDNRNRTVSAVKNVLERSGGTLVAPGAVRFLFTKDGDSLRATSPVTPPAAVMGQINALIQKLQELDDVTSVVTNIA